MNGVDHVHTSQWDSPAAGLHLTKCEWLQGFSISVMKADQRILQRLDAPTKASYWPVGVDGNHLPAKIPVPLPSSRLPRSDEALSRPQELNEQGCILEAAIEAATNEIINMKDSLNEWDSKVGDGDCGTTMCKGAMAILEDMKKHYPLNDAAETINEIGASIQRVMGGTSGIIHDVFCKSAYAKLKESNTSAIAPQQWADAFEASITAISKYGGASAGYRTLLDALIPASTVLQERLDAGDDPVTAFVLSSEAALSGAEATKHMHPQAGRSTYVTGEVLSTVPDPGAMAAAAWYRAAALAVKNKIQAS